jgi:hypothetical protein
MPVNTAVFNIAPFAGLPDFGTPDFLGFRRSAEKSVHVSNHFRGEHCLKNKSMEARKEEWR